jgi:glycosyltransferase involved in cell wall biosynthesis
MSSPSVSVVIPTYNRSDLLRRTLEALTTQSVAPAEFEVIVSDDGSSDDTAKVVDALRPRLRLDYHFQPDLGFRAALARNAGARLAHGDVLVFLDTGTLPGPDFITAHLVAHRAEPATERAVLGYVYGYRPLNLVTGTAVPVPPELETAIVASPPAELVERYRDEPAFFDIRHDEFAKVGFDLSRRVAPFLLFWTQNCSLPAKLFWAAGGFDEDYVGWGNEDLDLGFRLQRKAVPFAVSPEAWAVDLPHERDDAANWESNKRNVERFLRKFGLADPQLELIWLLLKQELFWETEEYYQTVQTCTEQSRDLDVTGEIERSLALLPPGQRIAVFGSGGKPPASLPPAVLVDYDRGLLEASSGGEHELRHNIGIRTPLADQSVHAVIITSRLRGLWDKWGDHILAEAHRVGQDVHIPWLQPG